MALQVVLLQNTLIKKELKSCVQSFSFFHQMIALKVGLSTFTKIVLFASLKARYK